MTAEVVNILESMDTVIDEEFPEMFINKVVPIMEHSKEEITDLLKSKSKTVLKQLGELAFAELAAKLPQYADKELFAPRNYELVAEDIYVFCFSATNALPDKRLDKSCLRPQLDFDSTHIEMNEANLQANEENKDIQSLISQCLKIQEKVMNLEATVKEQETRISNIEAENTRSKLKTVISASSDRSTDQAEGRVLGQPMKAMPCWGSL